MLSAALPYVGIGLLGVPFVFGLTMAYAIGHISRIGNSSLSPRRRQPETIGSASSTAKSERVERKTYGSFGASWAQRNPTFGSCSVGSPFVRKEERSRYGLLIYEPPRCTFAAPSIGPRGLMAGFFV